MKYWQCPKENVFFFIDVFPYQENKCGTSADCWVYYSMMYSTMYKHYVTSISFLLEVIILLDCSTDCDHITYSPRATSAKFRSSTKFWKSKLNTSLIIFWSNQQIHAQHLRLSKLEPEPILQLDLKLFGNVATKRLGNLWKPHHHLHQQDHRDSEIKVSRVHGR